MAILLSLPRKQNRLDEAVAVTYDAFLPADTVLDVSGRDFLLLPRSCSKWGDNCPFTPIR